MKIGIACHASVGGSVKVALALGSALARRGHEIHLFSPHLNGWGAPPAPGLHVHTLDFNLDRSPCELYRGWSPPEQEHFMALLAKACGTHGLEVLHFHYAVPFAEIFAALRRHLGRACPLLVGTLHGTDILPTEQEPRPSPELRAALLKMDRLTTVSKAHAALAQTQFALPMRPRVIPNFVTRPSPIAISRPFAADDGTRRLAHISNFRPVKSVVDVGRIALAVARRIDVELWLIGDGPEHAKLIDFAHANDFAQRLRVFGLVKDPMALLPETDLLLITSRYESFCMAGLEAMACGVPVLAPAVGGLPELIGDDHNGLLYPPGDIALAARLAIALLEDPPRLRAMRQRARWRAGAFAPERILADYESVYTGSGAS